MELDTTEKHFELEAQVREQAMFLVEYASLLMGAGVHTSRVARNTKRIGESLGLKVTISATQKSLHLSAVNQETGLTYTTLTDVPHAPISFEINTNLSRLSWDAYDEHLSLKEIQKRFNDFVARPKLHPIVVLLLSSFANASFCGIFGGDWFSIGIVFSATLCGMFAKMKLLDSKLNVFLTWAISAFIASFIASTSIAFDTTSEVAIATSVLFLIPGVPLINGFMDIMEGYVILGMSRLLNALLLILCLSIGMSGTIMLVKDSLI